jgi:hypothetical protein
MLKKILKEATRIEEWQQEIYTALHNIDASQITSGRLSLSRIPTSATANRFLVVRTANADPIYDALVADDIPSITRSKISDFWGTPFWANIPDKPSTFPPSAHASSHEYGGSDPVRNLDYLAIRGTTVIDSSRNLNNIVSAIVSGSGYFLNLYPVQTGGGGSIGSSGVQWGSVYASKFYGSIGFPQPLKRPLRGLEDLKMVQFREDGLPLEKTLPTHIANEIDEVRERVRREKIEMKKMKEGETEPLKLTEEDEKEIEDTVSKIVDSDTVNISHTIGWLVQCIKQLTDKVEQLENKIKALEEG